MSSLGDLAESVAQKLGDETFAPIEEAAAITEEAVLQSENSLFSKITFNWRTEDRMILERIQVAADAMFDEAFASCIQVIDGFFMQLRVPAYRDGQLVKDLRGHIVWEVDETTGNPIERWSQLTGQDIEMTLVNLQRLRLHVAPQVNKLQLEALLARHSATDASDKGWFSVMGTQGDRSARASRDSQTDRYHAFFRYYLYSVADTFLKEINSFIKQLENIRYWQVRTQK